MPAYQPIVIGAKYAVRISDFTDADAQQVTCFMCGHDAIVPVSVLRYRWPEYTRIISIERQFMCNECGYCGDTYWSIIRRVELSNLIDGNNSWKVHANFIDRLAYGGSVPGATIAFFIR